ncbi:MAG TPA: RNA polymerase sigma factor [Pyrinomonadaceae bacterium]|nr:RNA polymerase sigma factor [Pyrinomonadaceae bacterium]
MNKDEKSSRPDEELVRQAAAGDAAAFEEIHRRYHRFVYAVALRMTGNPADAEDMTQESFLSLLLRIGSFRGEGAFTLWLRRLTINQVLMHFRRRKSRPEDLTADGETPEPADGTPSFSQTSLVDRIAIERAVAALPKGCRTTFILHDVEGREHAEIARLTKRTPGNSKSQLHKARLRLRELLSTPPAPAFQN